MSEAPSSPHSDLIEIYERLRSRGRVAGRNAYALLVTRGMAEWIRTAAELFPRVVGTKRSRSVKAGVRRVEGDELPPGVLPELVPILASLLLGSMSGGAT